MRAAILGALEEKNIGVVHAFVVGMSCPSRRSEIARQPFRLDGRSHLRRVPSAAAAIVTSRQLC